MGTFSAKVAAMTKKYQMQMRITMQEAAQDTISKAQQVEHEGGRMRVDTGFLRASIGAQTGSMPSGESVNPDPKSDDVITYEGTAIAAALLKWQPGEVLFIGWTANYARPREYKDGFLRGAVEQWDGTVKLVAARIKQRI